MPKFVPDKAPNIQSWGVNGPANMPHNPGPGQGMEQLGAAVEGTGAAFASIATAFNEKLKASQRVTDVSSEFNNTVTGFQDILKKAREDYADDPVGYQDDVTKKFKERIQKGRQNLSEKDALTQNAYEAQANNYMAQQTPQTYTDAAAMMDTRSKAIRQDAATQFIKDHVGTTDRDTLTRAWEDLKSGTYAPAVRNHLLSPQQATVELTTIGQQMQMERAYLKSQTDPRGALAELNSDYFGGAVSDAVDVEGKGPDGKPVKQRVPELPRRTFMPSEALKAYNAMQAQREQGHDLELKHGKEYWTAEANARFIAHTQGNYTLRQHLDSQKDFKDQPDVAEHLLNRMTAYDLQTAANNKTKLEAQDKERAETATGLHKALTTALLANKDIMNDPPLRAAFESYGDLTQKADEYKELSKAIHNREVYGPGDESLKDAMKVELMIDPTKYDVPFIFNQTGLTSPQRQELLKTKQDQETFVKANGSNWMTPNAKALDDLIPASLGQDNYGLGGAEANRQVAAARIQFRNELQRQFTAKKGYLSPADEFQVFTNMVKTNRIPGLPYNVPPAIKKQYPMNTEGLNHFLETNRETMGRTNPTQFLEIGSAYLYQILRDQNRPKDADEEEADKKRATAKTALTP